MIELTENTPEAIQTSVAARMRSRRKELGLSQEELARRSGVSLGSLKRFEQLHEISLASLVRLSMALGCSDDFAQLFSRRAYTSIEEVIADAERARR